MPDLVTIGAAPAAKRPRWRNPYRAIPAVRWGVQGLYLAFLLLVGYEFWRFHQQAVAPGPVTATRPPSVESFLPISALVGLKRFLLTGYWDPVHPAGLTILAAAIVGALAGPQGLLRLGLPGRDHLPGAGVAGGEALLAPPLAGRAALARPRAHVAEVRAAGPLRLGHPLADAARRAGGVPALPLQRGRRREDAALLPRPLRHLRLGPRRPRPPVTRGEERLVPLGLPVRRAARPRQLRLAAAHRARHRHLQRLRRLHAGLPGGHPGPRRGPRSAPRSAPAASPAWRRARFRRAWG